ncbi:MAG: Gfo/Idh/MocA family protein [Armatimonadota bacterium]
MDKVGIAVVGCGMMAQNIHLPNIKKHPGIDLVWCCDLDRKILQDVKMSFEPRKVTTDASEIASDKFCQGVLISTTHTVRLPLIELFARSGKHIYVEKPIADNFYEMKKIIQVCRETGIKTQVGHNRRVAPAVRYASRVLQKHRSNPVPPKWRWDREGENRPRLDGETSTMVLLRVNDDYWSWKRWAFEHGALVNEMTHFADLACCFIPSNPVRVTTIGSKMANHVVTIEYADGSLATIFATAFGSFGCPKELIEIYHNGAAIIVDHLVEVRVAGVVGEPFQTKFAVVNDRHPYISCQGIEGYYRRVLATQREALECKDSSILPEQPDKGHFALLDDWVKCIMTGGSTICSVEVAAIPTAIILRALESESRGGEPIDINPSDYSF